MVTLIPSKIVRGFIVDDRDKEPKIVSYNEFLDSFMSSDTAFKYRLVGIKCGSFVGKLKSGSPLMVSDVRGKGDIRQVLKKDPLFDTKVLDLYRVASIERPNKVIHGADSALKEG